MKHMKKCRRCWWQTVKDKEALENWLLEVLGAEFCYHWQQRDALGQEGGFRVVHPEAYRRWLEQGPCVGCPCQRYCDEICLLRARWWDARVGRLRGQ